MVTIENDLLRANINLYGAELSSLSKKKTDTEYIWQADPHFWGRHSPILFPIVGRLRNDEYILENNRYSMTQHGFARDLEFECIHQEGNEASFLLKSNRETRLAYPFKFKLTVHYILRKNILEVQWEVENESTDTMYFSIGGHPAFKCPLKEGEERSDYILKFEKAENLKTQLLEDGLRTGEDKQFLDDSSVVKLTKTLFDNDAIILEELHSNFITLQKGEDPILSLYFEGFPYLGIWSKGSESDFICIEPWHGIADRVDHDYQFAEKEGIMSLEKGKRFFSKYDIEIH